MRTRPFQFSRLFSTVPLAALALLSLTTVASAQTTVYNENFNTGYTPNETLSDQNRPGDSGWTTNDEDTGGTYTYGTAPNTASGDIGQSDYVGNQTSLSTSSTDYAAFLGGGYGQSDAPGTAATTGPVTLAHSLPTSGATSLTFGADFIVTAPTAALPTHDSFGFALTGASGASLLSINFIPSTSTPATKDNITYTNAAGVTTATAYGITLSTTRYRLTINVNVTAGTFTASYQGENANGSLSGPAQTLFTGSATYGTGDITGYEALWSLTNNTAVTAANNPADAGTNNLAHTTFGNNVLSFDNVAVSVPGAVPEPSTYVLMSLGMLGLVAVVRNRRAQRA